YVTSVRGGNALFHNEGGGKFADVTEAAGVKLVNHPESAVFFDADGDGFLDLLVSGTAKWTLDTFDAERHYYVGPESLFGSAKSPPESNVYFHNNGDGTFTDRTEFSGLAGRGWSCECLAFDYDGDGAQDVFVAGMFGTSALFRNGGNGRFVNVTRTVF